jgi:dihydrofolate reductase
MRYTALQAEALRPTRDVDQRTTTNQAMRIRRCRSVQISKVKRGCNRKNSEYALLSVDGVVNDPFLLVSGGYRDDAYMRDGLGLLPECGGMLMGRKFFESSAPLWSSCPDHPWAERLNEMPKYVFTSTLSDAPAWSNSELVKGDIALQAARLKDQTPRDLIIWGHTQLADPLMRAQLIDVLDLSVHPLLIGSGSVLLREGLHQPVRLAATTRFSNILKITYEPIHEH